MLIDAERPEVSECQERTARKEHRCGECRDVVAPGQRYEVFRGLYSGEWLTCKTCLPCVAARAWLGRNCGGWVYHKVYDDLREHLRAQPHDAELVGLVAEMASRFSQDESDDLASWLAFCRSDA